MDIHDIREKAAAGRYILSRHARREIAREGLFEAEVEEIIRSGRIIEEDSDEEGTEALIEGWCLGMRFHVKVTNTSDDRVLVITAYPHDKRRRR